MYCKDIYKTLFLAKQGIFLTNDVELNYSLILHETRAMFLSYTCLNPYLAKIQIFKPFILN
jgi:hypothetical protein